MKNIIFIIGLSATGKDTIADYLCKQYNYHKVPSFTTRPMRDGETNGVEHTFVTWGAVAHSPESFCENRKQHMFASTYYGGHYYFATFEQLMQNDNTVYIIDEEGYKQAMLNMIKYQHMYDCFNVQIWKVTRPLDNISVDVKRLSRDKDRKSIPDEEFNHIIRNDYDIDYLYSCIDAIMHRVQ